METDEDADTMALHITFVLKFQEQFDSFYYIGANINIE